MDGGGAIWWMKKSLKKSPGRKWWSKILFTNDLNHFREALAGTFILLDQDLRVMSPHIPHQPMHGHMRLTKSVA